MISEVPQIQLYCEFAPVTFGKSPSLFLFDVIPSDDPYSKGFGLMGFKRLPSGKTISHSV